MWRSARPAVPAAGGPPLIVAGDLNIAPQEHDVWSHRQLLDVVSHTPVETEGLSRIIREGGFLDIARAAHPPEQKLYTWWSYRALDWAASNRGRRLDHIWADRGAAPRVDVASYRIHLAERAGEKPSDHVPVSVMLRG
jgi:exodeoxyribonuclease-3